MTRRLLRSSIVGACAVAVVACGVGDGARDRAVVEARTCLALLERNGRPADGVDVSDFEDALRHFEDGSDPYSTLQPFLRACPLRG